MEYLTSHLYFLGIQASLEACMYIKKIQVASGIQSVPWKLYHKKVLYNYFISCHRKCTVANRINTVHNGKVSVV